METKLTKETIAEAVCAALSQIDPNYAYRLAYYPLYDPAEDETEPYTYLDLYFPLIKLGILVRKNTSENVQELIDLSEEIYSCNRIPTMVFDALSSEAIMKEGLLVIQQHAEATFSASQKIG